MESHQMTPEESEVFFANQVEAVLSSFEFNLPSSKGMIKNDILMRNKQTRILEHLPSFIEKEYGPYFKSNENGNNPEASFKSKQDVYNSLVQKGITPLTVKFNEEYARICKASKLM